MDESPRPRLLAFSGGLGWARYAVALVGTAAAAVAMASVGNGFGYLEAGLLGVAGLALILDRVDVHVFARAMLWGSLGAGALGMIDATGSWLPWALLTGSASALLALGAAGLDSERGPFNPRVLRRTLVTMMVVGLSVAHVFAISAALTEMASGPLLNDLALELPSTAFTRATMFATPVLLAIGVLGLSRTKSWGLFAYLASIAGVIVTIALAYSWAGEVGSFAYVWVTGMAVLWGFGAVAALGAALPVLIALVSRRVPSKKPGLRWGRYAHAALVLTVLIGGVAVGALSSSY